MYLTSGQSLQVKLAGAVATTELPVTAAFFEGVSVSMDASAWGAPTTVTAGAAAVTAVADPGAGKMRQVKHLTVANVDTAAVVCTVQVNDGGTARIIKTITLAVGYSLEFTDTDGFHVMDTTGSVLSGIVGPAGPADEYVAFIFTTASPMTLKALAPGNVIEFVQVIIDTPFSDPAATLQVGTVATPGLMLATTQIDADVAGQSRSDVAYETAIPEFLKLTITPGASVAGVGHVLFRVKT